MKKSVLKKFAYTVAKVGANVQKGQQVSIYCSLDQAEFATMVQEACYKCGAKRVNFEWSAPPKAAINRYKYESVETLGEVPEYIIKKNEYACDNKIARIHIMSESPEALKGLDQAKAAKARMLSYPVIKPIIEKMDGHYQWTIVAVPSPEWAKLVFPGESTKKAMDKLWDAILKTTRIDDDPVTAWNNHNDDLLKRSSYLNNLDIDYLHYESANGTDFKVWLIKEGMWVAGGETTLEGIYYNPNMPTEECFTTPIKGRAEGKVCASKPLSYNGNLIENFNFTFKDGKVVEYHAERGEELLKQMLSMDENASYLGECALVPFESPVNETGILFYNTLFDENAVCHFALGRGFNECIRDHEHKSNNECKALGVNDSMIHVDFMIGTRDLSVTAVLRNGEKVKIFNNGTWAF